MCGDIDGAGDRYTKSSKLDLGRQTLHVFSNIWNLNLYMYVDIQYVIYI